MSLAYHIKDLSLASEGRRCIEWAERFMPVIVHIRKIFSKEKPLKNIKVGCCLHVTSETANLVYTLKAGGAEVYLCASNPLSTQDNVAAAIVKYFGISVFAIKGEDRKTYYGHIEKVLSYRPDVTIDDGADLVTTLHTKDKYREVLKKVIGGTEETTTGVVRLRSMAQKGLLMYPILAVNEAHTKYMFDNRYGTGQSTVDGIMRATNVLFAGKKVVVCGYGWCGRGVALRARGLGSNVIVVEVEPLRALEAAMDGFQVMPMREAAKVGDIFITVTGNVNVIDKEHFLLMKDGAIVCNSGHFNVEINIPALKMLSKKVRRVREFVDEYLLKSGSRIYLLSEGRLVNLSAAEGHPATVMDMSFSNQALCVEYVVKRAKGNKKLQPGVYPVPKEIDNKVALLKLTLMGIKIDTLTDEQKKYLEDWSSGT